MSGMSMYTEQGYLGYTYTHHVPRKDDLILWRNKQWRVEDVAHPTEDQRGFAIHYPRVLVRETNLSWITEEP